MHPFRPVILLNCCFVKDLPVVLTGAWQFSLKDTTNCGLLKSKLCGYGACSFYHNMKCWFYKIFLLSFFYSRFVVFCRFAREKRLRLWKDYVPSAPIVPIQNKEFTGKVSGRTLTI